MQAVESGREHNRGHRDGECRIQAARINKSLCALRLIFIFNNQHLLKWRRPVAESTDGGNRPRRTTAATRAGAENPWRHDLIEYLSPGG
jgi:hypothetical protein